MILRRIILITTSLIFALGILTTSIWKTSVQIAKKNYSSSVCPPKNLVFAVNENKSDYLLAYPGILPDHFLYPIKMIRDRIWLFLTNDPLKKAETLLLFADKRLAAGGSLVDKGKTDLGMSTVVKAEKYFERAVNQEKIAKEKGRKTILLLEKLKRAGLKHQEVLLEISKKIPDSAQPVLNSAIDYSQRSYEQVGQSLEKGSN